ncbi:TRAP transporter small permease subunit, partial [Cobetia marina]
QFRFLPRWGETAGGVRTEIIWIAFNAVVIYYSYDFVFNKMNLFWTSQTMGVPRKYFYLILPLAFTAMTVR